MNILAIILVIAAIIAFVVGFGHALSFLWYVAGVLIVIAIIVFVLRVISGRRV